VGLSANTATSVITSQGLGIPIEKFGKNNAVAGNVYKTNPPAGASVKKGHRVTIFISVGRARNFVTLANLVGLNYATASQDLTTSGLNPKVVFQLIGAPGEFANNVIAQDPLPGTRIETGKTVTLTVLSPQALVSVPNVASDSTTTAANALGNRGLGVASPNQSACSNTVPSGQVLRTNPAAGTLVQPQSTVTLIVSSGHCEVTVPNVVGLTQVAASNALDPGSASPAPLVAQFTYLDPNTDPLCAGHSDYVVDQDQAATSMVPIGTTVTMKYCPPAG
jgi:beta-lactam-binding protein with PASTA domain